MARSLSAIAARSRTLFERLDREQRIAAIGAALIVVSELLPWYTNYLAVGNQVKTVRQTALQAASWVELALLLVAAAVLVLLLTRADGKDVHLPASDGALIAGAGAWATILVVFRMLDRPEPTVRLVNAPEAAVKLGLDWGIFVALAATAILTVAGLRERRKRPRDPAAHSEPPA